MNLEILRLNIGVHLVAIEDLLPDTYELTLVARNTKMGDADLILSTDDLDKVILAIKNLADKPAYERKSDYA